MLRVVVSGHQRHCDSGQAEETTFHRRRHGAGIDHVVAEIGGIVDTGHDNVRLEFQQAGQRQVDAIGRRTGHRHGVVVDALEPDRQIQGQRIAGAGAIAVGCDHCHFVPGLAQYGCQHPDARRVDTVIIADQDAHLRFNRLIFQEFDPVTLQRGRSRPVSYKEAATPQVRRLLCRKRALGPTLSAVTADIKRS